MDLEELKQLINSPNERIIVIENGKPIAVILSFEGYKRIVYSKINHSTENHSTNNFFHRKEGSINEQETIKKELTLEDLPF